MRVATVSKPMPLFPPVMFRLGTRIMEDAIHLLLG